MKDLNLATYKCLVFDCDGVVLNSNKVKTSAFYNAVLPFGINCANKMVEYHINNGGVSRYAKFEHFLEIIVPQFFGGRDSYTLLPNYNMLLKSYADNVISGLLESEVAAGLHELRHALPCSRWFIVSGGEQEELRHVFKEKKIEHYFDGGIFGSPSTKHEILDYLISSNRIKFPSLFLGDSKYDLDASKRAMLDFIFISGWSEIIEQKSFVEDNALHAVKSLKSLLSFA